MRKSVIILLIAVVSVLSGYAQDDRQLIREGNKLYRSGQYAQAETTYRKALGKNPQNARASYNLGCALMKQGKIEEADKQFSLAVSSPQADNVFRSKNYYNKGVMYQGKKDYGKAIDAYKNALRMNPADEHARKNLALCKRQQQQQKQNQDQKNNQNQQDKKDQDDKQDKQQNKNKNQQDKQHPEKKDEMSKENAEQLLNAAMQEEKATQQRIKKAMQQPSKRNLDKNW